MIVYHGSDTIVDRPVIISAKRPLDFGGGFYVTTNKAQAEAWAVKVAYRNARKEKSINIYDFDLETAKGTLKILVFQAADEKWLDFICANRQMRYTDDYDIAIGPVADDKVYRVVVEYENGDIDKETALKNLKTEKLCDQILFHTERSLSFLKYIGTEVSRYE
ncbi:MAG: DUF3990 domain-containing protein [Clostridia bacterium]|nr:DUF3990 domain-containing protein [Clostridia bacterium]